MHISQSFLLRLSIAVPFFALCIIIFTGFYPVDEKPVTFGSEYFPYYPGRVMIYKTPFGDATTKITFKNGMYSIKNDGKKFSYHQELISGTNGIQIRKVYQKFSLLAFITKENSVTYNHPVMRTPMPLLEGKKWSWSGVEYVNGDSDNVYVNGRIIGLEKVRVPAGEFTALKIETIFKHDDSGNNKITDWIAPNVGIVKTRIEINGGGLIAFIRTVMGYSELVFELKEVK